MNQKTLKYILNSDFIQIDPTEEHYLCKFCWKSTPIEVLSAKKDVDIYKMLRHTKDCIIKTAHEMEKNNNELLECS